MSDTIEMTEEERERWLAESLAVEEDHPVLEALMNLLEEERAVAMDAASSVLVAEKHGALAHASGGMAYLTNLRARVEYYRREGLKAMRS